MGADDGDAEGFGVGTLLGYVGVNVGCSVGTSVGNSEGCGVGKLTRYVGFNVGD